jgi:hypothetical protein
MFAPRFEPMLEARAENEPLKNTSEENRHDNEVGNCRLCSLARLLRLGHNRSTRIGASPIRPRATARRSTIA